MLGQPATKRRRILDEIGGELAENLHRHKVGAAIVLCSITSETSGDNVMRSTLPATDLWAGCCCIEPASWSSLRLVRRLSPATSRASAYSVEGRPVDLQVCKAHPGLQHGQLLAWRGPGSLCSGSQTETGNTLEHLHPSTPAV